MSRLKLLLLVTLGLILGIQPAYALITGGEGNSPVNDPGWSQGAAAVFNVKARVAWWEGPPFGGGQYTAECRGDTAAFNAVLVDFARIEAGERRLYVHDGEGASFWLNPNREDFKKHDSKIDWSFTVWIPASFERLRGFRGELSEISSVDPVIHLYTGGHVAWKDVKVPEGIKVVDERLETHGFATTDGTVAQGTVRDLDTGKLLEGQASLQRIKPRNSGGYDYEVVATVDTTDGNWVMKSIPEGWFQIVVTAPGYMPRTARHLTSRAEPLWMSVNAELSKPARIEGIVTGPDGQPLENVRVRRDKVISANGQRYDSPAVSEVSTNAQGRFIFNEVPLGKTRIWCHKDGYCRPGLGAEVTAPSSSLQLQMVKSSRVQVVVEFGDKRRPEGYIVQIEPEGGSVVGSWGGSGNIDKSNQIAFENIPPGRYVLIGRPNPGSAGEETEQVTVILNGGESKSITLKAK